MNLLDRMAYDTGGYTVQEILSSFCKDFRNNWPSKQKRGSMWWSTYTYRKY